MMPITMKNRRKTLYLEIDNHLMNDHTPSVFMDGIKKKQEFRQYPFDMLSRLQDARQPPQHHPEGSVWNHTLLVLDEAAKGKDKSRDARVFMWAALLHDIGKPPTTRVRKGRITSYDHDKAGAELAREFLGEFGEDHDFIDKVSALVRYHMQILYVCKDLPFADIRGMKEQTDVSEVALLGLCDRLGRLGSDRASEENNIRMFIEKANAQ
jgi:putative nucleotidyltransferase with HDIG domain